MSLRTDAGTKADILPSGLTNRENRQRSTSKAVVGPRFAWPRSSVLARLSAISKFTDTAAKREVTSVVKKIERIRRHEETTIFERHAESSISISDAELAKLKSYCKKLVDLSSSGRATERYACQEIIRLSVEDPRVHLFLKERQLFPSDSYDLLTVTFCGYARFTIDDASVEVHGLWSDLLQISREAPSGPAPDDDRLANYLKFKYHDLFHYLTHRELSFLSARYLRYALKLRVFGNALFFITKLWRKYTIIAKDDAGRPDDESIVEWSNLDACFQCLPTGVLRTAFAPPSLLAELLAVLFLHGRENGVPGVFQIFFGIPEVRFESLGDGLTRYTFTQIRADQIHFRLLPLYRASLFDALQGSSPGSTFEAIVQREPKLREVIKQTVLDNNQSLWTGYCEHAKNIWDFHHRNLSSEIEPPHLSTHFRSEYRSSAVEQQALALFLAASLVSAWPANYLEVPSSVVSNVQDLIGTLSLPLFDNVPYLRRYRVKDTGRVFITSDHLPEPPTVLIKNFEENLLYYFTVDTLPLKGDDALWLHVDGRNTPFDVNQHFFRSLYFNPISAEDAREENPTYVAAVKVENAYHFTYAAEGSSSVRYTDEVGDEYESQDFFVLAQRKHRNILENDISSGVIGRWLPFWPVKDPDYCAVSESAKIDDEHLEALLDSFRRES